MPKRLTGTRPILPPQPAREMAERNAALVRWTVDMRAKVARCFQAVRKDFLHHGRPDAEWDVMEPVVGQGGRIIFKGNCNDEMPALKRALVKAGLPEDALSLVICRRDGEPHMVLAIETDQGTMICDDPHGCWPLDHATWRLHQWIAREARGRAWESLEPTEAVALTDLIPAKE